MLSARNCMFALVILTVLAVGIAVGICFAGQGPFAAAPTDKPASPSPAEKGGSAAVPLSAKKIVEEWGQGLPSHPGSIERWTLTAHDGSGQMITVGPSAGGPPAATAFLIFRTGKKFEEVWKYYAGKCGQDAAKESLSREVPRSQEVIRGGIQHGKRSEEFMAVDFGGLGPAKLGGEPGVRESHFGYFTEGYVVHVVIEEVARDRTANDKDSVKVSIFAAVR